MQGSENDRAWVPCIRLFCAVATRRKRKLLLRGLLQRRNPRQDHLDPRAAAGRRIEVEPAAQAVGHDVVDDMQTEPGAALIAAGPEERIESAAPGVGAHAAPPVGEKNIV